MVYGLYSVFCCKNTTFFSPYKGKHRYLLGEIPILKIED